MTCPEPPHPALLLNSAVLTTTGQFAYKAVTADEARALVRTVGWVSAIGHASTAQALSAILGLTVPVDRTRRIQLVHQSAVVLRLAVRPPEGVVLDLEQLETIGYELGLLDRLD